MLSISSTTELRDAIRLLEDRRDTQLQLIKDDFGMVVDSLRPSNIIKNSVSNITSSPKTMRNIVIAVAGIALTIITKRKFAKSRSNPGRQLIVSIIQTGIASLLAVKGHDIKDKLYGFFTQLISRRGREYS